MLTILKFTSKSCSPCRSYNQVFNSDRITEELKLRGITSHNIDIEEDKDTTKHYNISSVPTTVIVEISSTGNKEVKRKVGYMSESQLLKWLE
jgi:hypothetical protein